MTYSQTSADSKLNDQQFVHGLAAAVIEGQLTTPLEIIQWLEEWANADSLKS